MGKTDNPAERLDRMPGAKTYLDDRGNRALGPSPVSVEKPAPSPCRRKPRLIARKMFSNLNFSFSSITQHLYMYIAYIARE